VAAVITSPPDAIEMAVFCVTEWCYHLSEARLPVRVPMIDV